MTKKQQVILGRHPVSEALNEGVNLDKVLIERTFSLADIVGRAKELNIPVQRVPKEKLDKFGTGHQGVIAFRSRVEYTHLEDLVPHLFEQGKMPLLLVLDRITDVGNFGAISRSAEVLGCDALVFPVRDSAQLNADAMKRSSGALLRQPLCRVTDLVKAVRFLKESGISIVAADEKGEKPIASVPLAQPSAIIMGSEGQGIDPRLLRLADHITFIPQTGKLDSLNVSVATGIILYEAQRQRTG